MDKKVQEKMVSLAELAKELSLPKGYQRLLDSLAYNTEGGK